MDAKYCAAWQYVNLHVIQQANVSKKNKRKLESVLDHVVDWCYTHNVEGDTRPIEDIKADCVKSVQSLPILGWFGWLLLKFIIEQIIIAVLKRVLNANKNS